MIQTELEKVIVMSRFNNIYLLQRLQDKTENNSAEVIMI